MKRQKGFTLIELLIVMAIVGILCAVIIPNISAFMSHPEVIEASLPVSDIWLLSGEYYQTTWSVEYLPDGIFFGLGGGVTVYVPYSNVSRVVTEGQDISEVRK